MRFSLLLCLFIICSLSLFAQDRSLIRLIVCDKQSGETLAGATIYNRSQQTAISTNNYGFGSIRALIGDTIYCSFVGYTSEFICVDASNIKEVSTIQLETSVASVGEVTVVGDRDVHNLGRNNISLDALNKLPVFFSEPDVFKTLQLYPGIQPGVEGTSSIYVRGADPGQNLVILDDVPIYNCNHLLGFFSVINTKAIKSCKIYKGGFPAEYGGRGASVIDLVLYDGNTQKTTGEIEVGLLMCKAQVEGPLAPDKGSYNVAVRRTVFDLIYTPISLLAYNDYTGYYFGDVNAKMNYPVGERDRLFVNLYLGKDKAYNNYRYKDTIVGVSKFENSFEWGNRLASVRWNHIFANGSFINSTAYYTTYRYNSSYIADIGDQPQFKYIFSSGIGDLGLKTKFHYQNSKIDFIAGGQIVRKQFNIGTTSYENPDDDTIIEDELLNKESHAIEAVIHAGITYVPWKWVSLYGGLNGSIFYHKDSLYQALEPRLSVDLSLNRNLHLQATYTQMGQYIHLLTNATIGMPTEYWIPVQNHINPNITEQVSVGAAYRSKSYKFSAEYYQKWMTNLIRSKGGVSSIDGSAVLIENITVGNGQAKGLELFAEKVTGKTTGLVSYTISESTRCFDEVNNGKTYNAQFGRKHNFSVALNHNIRSDIQFSAAWVFMSGFYMTLPTQTVYTPGLGIDKNSVSDQVDYVDAVNNYRTPNYHRLDVNVSFIKEKPKGTRTWRVGIYNAYMRKNVMSVSIYDTPYTEPVLRGEALFPFLPSVSYIFNFN